MAVTTTRTDIRSAVDRGRNLQCFMDVAHTDSSFHSGERMEYRVATCEGQHSRRRRAGDQLTVRGSVLSGSAAADSVVELQRRAYGHAVPSPRARPRPVSVADSAVWLCTNIFHLEYRTSRTKEARQQEQPASRPERAAHSTTSTTTPPGPATKTMAESCQAELLAAASWLVLVRRTGQERRDREARAQSTRAPDLITQTPVRGRVRAASASDRWYSLLQAALIL